MPTFVAAAASGGAGIAVSQALAHAANIAAVPALLFDVQADLTRPSQPEPALFPTSAVDAHQAAAAVGERDRSLVSVVNLREASMDCLRLLLPIADGIVIPATRIGRDLDDAAELYETIAALQIFGPLGRALEPWLLPSGWAGTKNPARLRGWQQQLERRVFPGGLRSLPMTFPWTDRGSLLMSSPARVEAVGATLLDHLLAIADGRAPIRPAAGLAGGDPWPDLPPPAPVLRFPGVRMRPHLLHGA